MSEKQINSSNIENKLKDQEGLVENDNQKTSKEMKGDQETKNEFDQHILGEYLRSLRTEKNISLKQLSIDTKINESVLQNLEEQNFNVLPRKIYLQGFIKTYCLYFKQDPSHAMDLLEKVFHQVNPVTDVQGRFENHQGTKINQKALTKIVSTIVAAILIVLLVRKLFFTPKLEVINTEITTEKISSSTPLVGSPSNIELTQESMEIKEDKTIKKPEATERKPKKIVIAQKTKIDNSKPRNEKSIENLQEEGDQLPTEITFKKFPENYLSYTSSSLNEIKEFVPSNILYPPSGVSEKVIISAKNDKTWIAYQKDDEEIKQLILKEGKVLVISGDEVRLVIGNSNSIHLVHNLKEVDIKSKTGIKSLVFPKSVSHKYRLPLFYQDSAGDYVSSGKSN